MEWQPELNPNMDLNGMFPGPKSKPIDVGPAYVQFPGEFPDFKQKVFDSTKKYTGFKRLFPAYLVTENIKTFMKKVDTYNDLKREYDNLREEYNEAVKNYQSIKKIYEVAKDVWYGEEALRIEEEGPEVADARRGEP